MLSFENWLKALEQEDVREILHEYYLMATGQDECEIEFELEIDLDDIRINFHRESVLYDIDKEVAEIGYQILKEYYPDSIDKNIKETAKLRGFTNVRKTGKKNSIHS